MKWWRGMLGLDFDGAPATSDQAERKDIEPWRGTQVASTENGNNFTTNQVTVADYRDIAAAKGKQAEGHAATWACIQLIAGTGGSLPLGVWKRASNGVKVQAYEHPLYSLLHDSPNFALTALDFWEFAFAAIELRGNFYARIMRRAGPGSAPTSLLQLDANHTRARKRANGFLEYVTIEDGLERVYPATEILHLRGPMATVLGGVTPLQACRSTFNVALEADSAAGTIFSQGLHTSGVLSTHEDVELTKDEREEFNEYLGRQMIGARNMGRPMVLDRGMKWTQINLSPEDVQMLETRRFSGEQICTIFGVPPHMIGYGSAASNWGTGKEVDVLGFVKFSMRKRLKRVEQALAKQLLSPADKAAGMTIEFNLEALLRGDSQGRSEFYEKMVRNGIMTRNEIRALENLPPVDGGDEITVQAQNVPLGAVGDPAMAAPPPALPKSAPPFTINVTLPEFKIAPAEVTVNSDFKRGTVTKTVTQRDDRGLIETWTESEDT